MHVPPKRMLAELELNEFLTYSVIDFIVDVVLVVASRSKYSNTISARSGTIYDGML